MQTISTFFIANLSFIFDRADFAGPMLHKFILCLLRLPSMRRFMTHILITNLETPSQMGLILMLIKFVGVLTLLPVRILGYCRFVIGLIARSILSIWYHRQNWISHLNHHPNFTCLLGFVALFPNAGQWIPWDPWCWWKRYVRDLRYFIWIFEWVLCIFSFPQEKTLIPQVSSLLTLGHALILGCLKVCFSVCLTYWNVGVWYCDFYIIFLILDFDRTRLDLFFNNDHLY